MPQNAASKGEIFVFDDEAETRETLSMALQEEGYEVICFADGAALLSLARTRVPACVFLEIRIPDKIGLDILKKLRSENYPAPIFMISGQGDISMAVDAIKSGAIDFIEKPFRSSEIIARVKVIDALSQVGNGKQYPKTFLPYVQGREPLTRRERQVLETNSRRSFQQGSWTAAWNKPANDRRSSSKYHEKSRRKKCSRIDSPRTQLFVKGGSAGATGNANRELRPANKIRAIRKYTGVC